METVFRIYIFSHDVASRKNYMTWYVCTDKGAMILSILRIFLKNHCKISLETTEKCSCVSSPPTRKEEEGLPEAVSNITLAIMEDTQTEGSVEEKKPLQSGDI